MKKIYLDNNGSLKMSKEAINYSCEWFNIGNPGGDNEPSIAAKKMISQFTKLLSQIGGFTNVDPADINSTRLGKSHYTVILNSCGSEANSHIIRSASDSYRVAHGKTPHIIASAVEHKSIIRCLEDLHSLGLIEYTLVECDVYGKCDHDKLKLSIKKNTALITIMHANNETGVINDISAIAKICHSKNIPFHTDMAQTWGKHIINLPDEDIDAVSITFHKCGGPIGLGALIIKTAFLQGYKLKAIVHGNQNGHLRGGTENCPAIAGSLVGLTKLIESRSDKNKEMEKKKVALITLLRDSFPDIMTYSDYLALGRSSIKKQTIVLLSGLNGKYFLSNTLLIAIAWPDKEHKKCNIYYKKKLEKQGITVSIGSACNTSDPKASHVLDAIHADKIIKRGALRISMSDETTISELRTMVNVLSKC